MRLVVLLGCEREVGLEFVKLDCDEFDFDDDGKNDNQARAKERGEEQECNSLQLEQIQGVCVGQETEGWEYKKRGQRWLNRGVGTQFPNGRML